MLLRMTVLPRKEFEGWRTSCGVVKVRSYAIHIHCKSHTCENLDKCCINALSKVESQLKITGMKIQRQPPLKSFVNQDVLQFVPLLYY